MDKIQEQERGNGATEQNTDKTPILGNARIAIAFLAFLSIIPVAGFAVKL